MGLIGLSLIIISMLIHAVSPDPNPYYGIMILGLALIIIGH